MSPKQHRLARFVMADGRRRHVVAQAALRALPRLEALGLRDRYERVVSLASFAHYWAGVGAEAGSESAWIALRRVARTASGTPVALDLDRIAEWRPPRTGSTRQVDVVRGDRVIGTAPVIWGGVPFTRERFIREVVDRFGSTTVPTDDVIGSVRLERPMEVAR